MFDQDYVRPRSSTFGENTYGHQVGMEDLPGALRAAQAKLDLLKRCHLLKWSRNTHQLFLDRLGDALVSDMPAAHMEVWSFFWFF